MATETFEQKKLRLERVTLDSNPAFRDRYSDFNTSFAVHPIKKDLSIKTNVESIKQSVRNLLLTDRGERFFQPTIGCRLRQLLFETFTPQTTIQAKQFIAETLRNHEPRVDVTDITISPYPDNNALFIQVVFTIINIEDPVTLDVILERVR